MKRSSIVLMVLALLAVWAVGTGYFLMSLHSQSASAVLAPPTVEGHVYFLSSEQLSENSSQGIDDQVRVVLTHIANPAAQKSYYAWLLSDNNQQDTRTLLLGVLPVEGGTANLFYAGNQQHTNLLETMSRFLVTEENTAVMPITPSPDTATWRYYAAFSQTLPTPARTPTSANTSLSGMNVTQFSFLEHLRHLLASDPMLNDMELPGGLNNWLYRNMGKVLEWTSSTRENWEEARDVNYIRRQLVRTLMYLDGISFVQMDLPPHTPLDMSEHLARIGLLEMNGLNQNPSCYLDSIAFHLNGLIQSLGTSPSLHKNISDILTALSAVRNWLNTMHQDAVQLMKMSNEQLAQAGTLPLLNDLIDNANHAYGGQIDSTTGEMRGGILWIHTRMQALAVLDVTLYKVQGV